MENFQTPYASTSVGEFWRRWHISLSSWFRDYVYVPMGGSRVDGPRQSRNLLVTFAISGLWHGANWTYVVWGLLNGIYLVIGKSTLAVRNRLFGMVHLHPDTAARKILMWASTFALTCFAWIFFRANSLSDAWYIVTHLGSDWNLRQIATEQFLLRQLPVAVVGIAVLEIGQLLEGRISVPELLGRLPVSPRWVAYASFVVFVLMFGVYRNTQFIYFQF